ncbi:unnamed protein product [Rotaria sp. Silwood2]|nr:unnamed protein product [Rotaria sp. Silwood2]
MTSSLLCHPDTAISSSSPLVPIQALSKIPRLKPAQSTCLPSSSSTTTAAPIVVASTDVVENDVPVFNQTDTLRIYQGKNIVFFGDCTIRKIYRDLLRLLHKGKLMNDVELQTNHTYHRPYVHEVQIEKSGISGMYNQIDCRRFVCEPSSTVVYFIHLGTILNTNCPLNIEWLQQITQGDPIDVLVVSCAYPDLSFHRLEIMNWNFQTILQRFESELPIVLTKLKFGFSRRENRQPILIWISPIPHTISNDIQNRQFVELTDIFLNITNQLEFEHLTRMHSWCENYKSLFVKEKCYFSPIGEYIVSDYFSSRESYLIIVECLGIRHLTNQITEIVSNKQHRQSYVDLLQPINNPILISQPPFPIIDLTFPHPTDLKFKQRKKVRKRHRKKRLNPGDKLKST